MQGGAHEGGTTPHARFGTGLTEPGRNSGSPGQKAGRIESEGQ